MLFPKRINRSYLEIYQEKSTFPLDILFRKAYIHYKYERKEVESMSVVYLKDFPEDLHRKAKSEAALMGISMKEIIIRALTEYLKKRG